MPQLVRDRMDVELNSIIDNGYSVLYIIAQKLVAQALTLGGTAYETGNVHEFNGGRCIELRIVHFRQHVQTAIRHGYHAHVGLDGAEGVVGAFCAGVGDGVVDTVAQRHMLAEKVNSDVHKLKRVERTSALVGERTCVCSNSVKTVNDPDCL